MQVIQEDHIIYPEPRAQPEFVSENSGKLKRVKEMLSRSTCLYCLNPCIAESHKGCHIFIVRIVNHLSSYFEQNNQSSLTISPLYCQAQPSPISAKLQLGWAEISFIVA